VSGSVSQLLGSQIMSELTPLFASSTVPSTGSASIDVPVQFSLLLTDTASGQSGTLDFTARLHGEIFPAFDDIFLQFHRPFSRMLQLGQHHYSLDIAGIQTSSMAPPFTAAPRPLVGVTSAHAPEPSALTLAGAGVLSLAAWYRRRRALSV